MWSNTLAFYLAVASVMFAVVPSLPMPQEGVIDELRRARHTVSTSLFLLLASIGCILVSFAAATAVVVDNEHYYVASDFLLTPSVIGWFFCLIAMVSFFIRVMRLVFYRNSVMRQIYKFSFSAFLKMEGRALPRHYRRIIGISVVLSLIVPAVLELYLLRLMTSIARGLRRLWREQSTHAETGRPSAEDEDLIAGPIYKYIFRLVNWADI